ncbi:MAG: putative DNA modification/repair radical SAM protein [Niabella sp.]|nr:putative DNA modification/repair radical SAM protein [Niabella sp.]
MERIREKLTILADAAKYDVSCASSGSNRKNTKGGVGDTGSGICHSYAEDGRCVSLLKILLTNFCIYDCAFCISRKSNQIKRAAFTVKEVVDLTMNFYRRNYIEGLFLSSGIFKNADYTMERMLAIVKKLRLEENYNGYIHLKTIPGASQELVAEAGLYADRMSINLEMPTEAGLKAVAPEKSHTEVRRQLATVNHQLVRFDDERRIIRSVPKFVPAGQSTQMVVGATPETDWQVLHTAAEFYNTYALKRVYYSGYIPINTDERVPMLNSQPPLMREHRLYQADWLMRFYGFAADEIVNATQPHLELEVDPKLSWALRHPQFFPVDLNRADFKTMIRVPGIGRQSAQKIIATRQFGKIYVHQLKKMGIAYNRAQYFVTCTDALNRYTDKDPQHMRALILKTGQSKYTALLAPQLPLF